MFQAQTTARIETARKDQTLSCGLWCERRLALWDVKIGNEVYADDQPVDC